MSDPKKLVIINSDIAMFDPSSFLPAIPVPPVVTAPMSAGGTAKAANMNVCINKDEKKISAPSSYMTSSHPIPGSGIFKINALAPNQLTKKTKNTDFLITKGVQFIAALQVNSPAHMPTPAGPVPSPVAMHPGKGLFPFPKNVTVFAG